MAESSIVLPNNILEPLVRAEIQAALSRALGTQQQLVDAVAKEIVTSRVDRDGKPTTSSYDTRPFVEWITAKKMHEFITQILLEELELLRPVFKAALVAQMKKDKSAIVQAFVEGMLTHHITDSRLRYNLNISSAER